LIRAAAAYGGKEEMVKLLLARGADPSVQGEVRICFDISIHLLLALRMALFP
jgi:hypothetical protein